MTQTMQTPVSTDQPRYEITQVDKDRVAAITAAWKAYHGQLEKPLLKMEGEADDNVMVNVCLPIVEAGVDFLFGQELELSIGDGDPDEAKTFLDLVWGRKETRIPLLQKLATNGALARNAFLRIVPGKPTPGKDQQFRLVAIDPATVYMQTANGDCDTILLYCIQYSCTEKINGRPQQVFYREEIARIDPDGDAAKGLPDDDSTWELRKWTQVGSVNMEPKPDKWVTDGPPVEWPYQFSPLFTCQNLPMPNDAWGMPDITAGIIGLNNALNLASSSTARNIKLLAQPIIFASGIDDSNLSLTPGHINLLPPGPDSKMGSVTVHSDVAASLAFIEELRGDIDQESHVPGVASGRMKELPRLMSGVAIELAYLTLIMKNAKKRTTYGELIIDVSKALFVLGGFSADIDVTLQWQNALPKDDLQGMQATVLKKQIGISNATLQEEEGYDPEEEAQRAAQEAQDQLTMFARGQGMPPALPTQPGQPAQPPAQPESPFIARQA